MSIGDGWRAAVGVALLAAAAACGAPAEEERAAAPAPAAETATGQLASADGAMIAAAAAAPTESLTVTVYKSPTCGCCRAWVDHMQQNGFRVVSIDTSDMAAVKKSFGVREEHGSCHTAKVGDYVLEGHVPAVDVKRLLAEKPQVAGLAVPGMPAGSPGMEVGGMKDPYDVVAWTKGGATSVFAKH
jgi:hypothetical protein